MPNGLIIAISMYSSLPMPQVEWSDKNRKYVICFFPVVGMIIAAIQMLLFHAALWLDVPLWTKCAVFIAVPVLVTGGIHLDGFVDTEDALRSCLPKEKKAEILKDPHVGAFGVIRLILYFVILSGVLIMIFSVMEETGKQDVWIGLLSGSFILSRIFSGLACTTTGSARKEGLLYAFAGEAGTDRRRAIILLAELAAVVVSGCLAEPVFTAGAVVVCIVTFLLFKRKVYLEFGGISGDPAGWFLCRLELYLAVWMAVWLKLSLTVW